MIFYRILSAAVDHINVRHSLYTNYIPYFTATTKAFTLVETRKYKPRDKNHLQDKSESTVDASMSMPDFAAGGVAFLRIENVCLASLRRINVIIGCH